MRRLASSGKWASVGSILAPLLIVLSTLTLVQCSGGEGDISCTASPPPSISSTPPTQATVGQQYQYYIAAEHQCFLVFVCRDVRAIAIPPGAKMGNDYLTWTPTPSYANSNISFSIATVPDDCGNSVSQSWVVHVLPDTTPPQISSVWPLPSSTLVPVGNTIIAAFSEDIAPQSATIDSFLVSGPLGNISGTVNTNRNSVTFIPSTPLPFSSSISVTLTTAIKDLSGNALSSNYLWSFTTEAQDLTPPTVISTTPIDREIGVLVTTPVTVTFSEQMSLDTINSTSFTIDNGVTGVLSFHGLAATLTPSAALAYSTTYTATITVAAKDASGNSMAAPYSWTFTTGSRGASFRIPDTNQVGCFDASGIAISCAGTGQDGDIAINIPSHTDNGDGTVRDNITNLLWQKQDDGVGKTWAEAMRYCSQLNLAGLTGWRMPSPIELFSIADYRFVYPAIDNAYFPGTNSSLYYWAAKQHTVSSMAMVVHFAWGFVVAEDKDTLQLVRCVR